MERWTQALFGDKTVYVKVDDEGRIIESEPGKASIKYQNKDGAKIYTPYASKIIVKDTRRKTNPKGKGSEKKATANDGDTGDGKDASSSSSDNRDNQDNRGGLDATDGIDFGTDASDVQMDASSNHADKGKDKSTAARDMATVVQECNVHDIVCYAEGACTGASQGPCGAGVVLCTNIDKRERHVALGHGNGGLAELSAVRMALKMVRDLPDTNNVQNESANKEEVDTEPQCHACGAVYDAGYDYCLICECYKPTATKTTVHMIVTRASK